jgi:tryptophan-rich sensory protein
MRRYTSLKKPFFMPPSAAFPVVWSSLYLGEPCVTRARTRVGLLTPPAQPGMGYASVRVYEASGQSFAAQPVAWGLFGFQLLLNFAWSSIYFGQVECPPPPRAFAPGPHGMSVGLCVRVCVCVCWVYLGCVQHRLKAAMANLALQWLLVVATIRAFAAVDTAAGRAMVPLLVWLTLAGSINAYTLLHNPRHDGAGPFAR